MNTPDIFETIISTTVYWDHITSTVGEFALKILTVLLSCIHNACKFQSTADLTFANSILFKGDIAIFRGSSADAFFTDDVTKIFHVAGNALILGLTILALFKNLFADSRRAEPPTKIIFRSTFYTFLVSFYDVWVNAIFKILFFPVSRSINNIRIDDITTTIESKFSMSGTGLTDDSFMSSTKTTEFGFASLSLLRAIVLIIMLYPLIIQFGCLFLELIERFIHIFLLVLFGPLLLACGASPSTERIASTWLHVFINTTILLVVNLFLSKLSLLAFTNFVSNMCSPSGYASLKDTIMPFFLLYVLIRVSYKSDDIFNSLGLETLSAHNMFEKIDRLIKQLT